MAWHIKKTSIMTAAGVGEVYYKGNNCWTENFEERSTYTSQAKAKAVDYIWEKKITAGWDVTAVNENA